MTDSTSHTGGSATEQALSLFEDFLERFHSAGASFDALCQNHPEFAARFERWWGQLVQTGEVREADSTAVDPELPDEGSAFGHFQIERELGRGAQGTVFLARDARTEREVALKVLPKFRGSSRDRVRRFAREAELASRLDHPGLCAVYESGELHGSAFLAMRYIEGDTLAAHIARASREFEQTQVASSAVGWLREPPSGPDGAIHAVIRLFDQIAAALHAAHQERLIHRDVKPGNVVIDRDGQPVLLDFGLARDDDSDVLTLTGDLVGTPAYMSPEQITARIELDARTDVYSLGAMFYECLTLRRPFDAPTRSELYQKIVATEPVDPRVHNPAISKDLAVVVLTALEKDRDRRYQSAADLREDLRRLRAEEPVRARLPGPFARSWRWARRNPVVAVSAALVFLALSTGLAVSLYFQAETERARSAFHRLSNRGRLEGAIARAEELGPAWPENLPAMRAWVRDHAQPLASDLPEIDAALRELRTRALPYTAEHEADDLSRQPRQEEIDHLRAQAHVARENLDLVKTKDFRSAIEDFIDSLEKRATTIETERPKVRTYRFARVEDQAAHTTLHEVADALRAFLAPTGVAARMRQRIVWAEESARVEDSSAARWTAAIRDVQANSRYAGLQLKPQVGLVPLGPDPASKLEEFALVNSGAIPKRDADGKLAIDGESAMVFVLLPGKDYVFSGAPVRRAPHVVKLDPYFISKFEMSRGQWRRLGGRVHFGSFAMQMNVSASDEHPIESISWVESVALLQDHGLDLPTEAQWEYAARGGRRSNFWWGNGFPFGPAPENFSDGTKAALMGTRRRIYRDGYVTAAPIASLRANRYGLHHVHGNVHEWCRENYHIMPIESFSIQQGDGLLLVPSAPERIVRGGSFTTDPNRRAFVTARMARPSDLPTGHVGLRPVRKLR